MKQEYVLKEAVDTIKHNWRHRPGQELPAAILDTVDALWKEDRKPLLTHKKKSPTGWHMIFTLPPGVSFMEVQKRQEYFSDACRGFVEMKKIGGYCHMNIVAGHLENSYPYVWTPREHKPLITPIGYSPKLEMFNLADSPHLLVAGVPGYGKSNFLHVLIHALLPHARIGIIDMKRLEFAYLKNHCALARDEKEALALMKSLSKEMDRRIAILEKANVVKIQDYPGDDMPYIVLVIDELAEISDEKVLYHIDRIVRLARAVGISVVGATQRPSTKVLSGDTRAMFYARLCFQVADELNSRMILGDNCPLAAHLPGIKGRAIWKYGTETKEVQTMFLPLKQAKKLLSEVEAGNGWVVQSCPRLPAR